VRVSKALSCNRATVILLATFALIALLATGCSAPPKSTDGKPAADAKAHWLAASKSLATIQDVADRVTHTDPDWAQQTVPGLASSLESMVASATKELDATEQAAGDLAEGAQKSSYLAAVKSGREAVAKSVAAIPLIRALPTLWAKATSADKALTTSREQVNSAVDAGNANKYSKSIASARKGVAQAKNAELAIKQLAAQLRKVPGFNDKGGVKKALKAVDAQRAMAEASTDAATAGRDGSVSRYNAAVARYRKAGTASDKQPEILDVVGPQVFTDTVTDALRVANNAFKAAQSSYAKAVQAAEAKQ
jgi:hypothetical protein